MKVLKIILILVVVVIALVLVASLIAPKEMNVKTEQVIAAPMDVVWDNISTFEKRDGWSPWYDIDPDMKVTFDGETGTVGASTSWSGNKEVGSGKQTFDVIDAEAHSIDIKVEHDWGEGMANMKIEDMNDGTVKVHYTYNEKYSIPGNLFGAIMGAEDMMSGIFSTALGKLKTVAEDQAAQTPKPGLYTVEEVQRTAVNYVGNKTTQDIANMTAYFQENMPKVGDACKDIMSGIPVGLYWTWDEETGKAETTPAIPVSTDKAPEGFEIYVQPEGTYLQVDYFGDYSKIRAAHEAIGGYMEANGWEMNGAEMEEYVTDPGVETDPAKWLTKVLYPVKKGESTDVEM